MSAPALPDWVTETPGETTYGLFVFEGGGGSEQEIDITREEFLALKRQLAIMRGYPVEKMSCAWEAIAS